MKGMFITSAERPLLAELRSPSSTCKRLYWRKQSLKLDEPAAKTDPQRTLRFQNSAAALGTLESFYDNDALTLKMPG
jgi:hypothetical protein